MNRQIYDKWDLDNLVGLFMKVMWSGQIEPLGVGTTLLMTLSPLFLLSLEGTNKGLASPVSSLT